MKTELTPTMSGPLPDNLQLRNGVYYTDFRIRDERYRRSLKTGTLTLAKQRLREFISQAHQGELGRDRRQTLTVKEWVEDYISTHLVNRVERSCTDCSRLLRNDVLPFLRASRRIDAVTTSELVRLRTHCWGKTKPATQNRNFALVKHLFSEAKRRKLLKDDPARDVPKLKEVPKKSRTLSDKELGMLLLAAGEPFKSFFLLAVMTGLRKGELIKLRHKHIQYDDKTKMFWLHLRNDDGFRTKNGRDRKLPVNSKLTATMTSWVGKRGDPETLLFTPTATAKYYDPRKHWAKVRERLGLKDVTLHGFRRTFGTILHRSKTPMGTIQELLGHGNISQTRAYIDTGIDELASGVDGLDQTLASLSFEEPWTQNGHKDEFQG
jgi:integrase